MKLKSPFLTKLAARVMVSSLRLLFATIRKEFILPPGDFQWSAYDPNPPGRCLYCTWHDSIVMPLFMGKSHNMAALVSQHQDGSYLAETMKLLGIVCVRGSSMRGAVQALRETLTATESYHITITPDGPRGPRRVMKDGIVFLSSRSGRPIVPMTFEYERAWSLKGRWTDLVIPKPFSRVRMILGSPIFVPPHASREVIEDYMHQVQQAMDHVYQQAEERRAA